MRRALIALAAVFMLVAISLPAAFTALDARYPPPLERAGDLSFEVLDRDGRLLRAFANDDGRWRLDLHLAEVDPRFIEMLLAYEDKRFYSHSGVDPLALARAALQCLASGEIVSGGSTITMQLARLIEPSGERSIGVKILQIFRAIQIERRLDKPEILRLYLTLAPFGGNIEGLRAASLAYFGREPGHLPPAMAAMLVALPQAPEARRPDRHPQAARAARDRVLARLAGAGIVERAVADAASAAPAPDARAGLPMLAPHLAAELAARPGAVGRIATTIEAGLQARLEALVADEVARAGPSRSAALLVADHETGEILAQVGSPGLFDAARDGAIDMTARLRSPGSTLKPFIYGLGFEKGMIAPATLIEDRPTSFAGYRPENFDFGYQGTVSVTQALAQSLNIPAVAVLDAVGPQQLLARLRAAGARPILPPGHAPGLAVGLGGVGLTLRDLVQLYGALARGGEVLALSAVRAVRANPDGARLMSAAAAHDVREILRSSPPPVASAGGRIAFKTGTSYGYRDAWAIGFDGRHVVGAWVGRPDGAPIPGLSGRDAAAPLLFDAFARIGRDRAPFKSLPEGLFAQSARELPYALRRFAAGGAPQDGGEPLALVFPPDGARLQRAGAPGEPLAMKAVGGRLPLTWFVNGRPVAGDDHRRRADWLPDGPGFASLAVVDAAGRSARSNVFLEIARKDR